MDDMDYMDDMDITHPNLSIPPRAQNDLSPSLCVLCVLCGRFIYAFLTGIAAMRIHSFTQILIFCYNEI